MSLVSTYVRATDGKLYANPTLQGKGWFICFDDDDPVELVVSVKCDVDPSTLLSSLGIKHTKLVPNGVSGRLFSSRGYKFEDAASFFFEIKNRIPVEHIKRHDGVVAKEKIHQGVIYDPKEV